MGIFTGKSAYAKSSKAASSAALSHSFSVSSSAWSNSWGCSNASTEVATFTAGVVMGVFGFAIFLKPHPPSSPFITRTRTLFPLIFPAFSLAQAALATSRPTATKVQNSVTLILPICSRV
jgi:hypothetical protein